MQATAWKKIFINLCLTENLYLDYTKNAYDSTIEAKQQIFLNRYNIWPNISLVKIYEWQIST